MNKTFLFVLGGLLLASCGDDSLEEKGTLVPNTDSKEISVTSSASDVSCRSVKLKGYANGANGEFGFCYSSSEANPTFDNASIAISTSLMSDNSYEILIDKLLPSTTYYYRAFATVDNVKHMAKEVQKFTTSAFEADAIDLGLSVKWASCNLGAFFPEESGLYFSWGDTKGYKHDEVHSFDRENYIWSDEKKYNIHYKTELDIEDDAAFANWEGAWRLPNNDEIEELKNRCKWNACTKEGIKGYQVVGPNGNSIFLPSAGYRKDNNILDEGNRVLFWSSSLNTDWSAEARYLVYPTGKECGLFHNGLPIRPVNDGPLNKVSSIKISCRKEYPIYCQTKLSVKVLPEDASRTIEWESSDVAVATVTCDGKLNAISKGSVRITAKAKDGSKVFDSADINIVELEYVDLGKSVRWATCNLGAGSPEETGFYYAWNEIEPRSNYFMPYIPYNPSTTLDYDAASYALGKDWRIPSSGEVSSLLYSCDKQWDTVNGVKGLKLTSKINGNSIFIPTTGYMREDQNEQADNIYLRVSDQNKGVQLDESSNSPYILNYLESDIMPYYGLVIRPVYVKETQVSEMKIIVPNTINNNTLILGHRYYLSVSYSPSYASNPSFEWSSSNNSVASIPNDGYVLLPISTGSVTITAKAVDGSELSDSQTFDVVEVPNVCEAVDLGLSVKWATCNVGATDPLETGTQFAWGETEQKERYEWNNYKWGSDTSNKFTKYCTNTEYGTVDKKTILDLEDDAAHVKWGGPWRMPTVEEMNELLTMSEWHKLSSGGYEVKGPNGNSIIINSRLWTSSLYDRNSYAYSINRQTVITPYARTYGIYIRPVCP